MKIAQICRRFYPFEGGIETVAKQLSEYLVSQGHEVHIFTPSKKGTKKYEEINGIKIHRYSHLKLLNEPIYYFYNDLKKIKPDIIHCHYANPWGYFLSYLYARKYKIPIIVTYHAQPSSKLLVAIVSKITDKLLFYPTVKTNLSPVKKIIYTYSSLGPNLKNSIVIHNGIDTQKFKPMKTKKEFDIIMASRLIKAKRVDWILKAAAEIDNKLQVLITGTGPEEARLKNIAKQLKLNVTFAGNIAHDNMPLYYNKSRVFVSASESEGFPVTMIEALACEIPALYTKTGGVSDVLDDKFTFTSYEEMKEKLSKLLTENRKLQTSNYEPAKLPKEFSAQIFNEKYKKVYEEAVN